MLKPVVIGKSYREAGMYQGDHTPYPDGKLTALVPVVGGGGGGGIKQQLDPYMMTFCCLLQLINSKTLGQLDKGPLRYKITNVQYSHITVTYIITIFSDVITVSYGVFNH